MIVCGTCFSDVFCLFRTVCAGPVSVTVCAGPVSVSVSAGPVSVTVSAGPVSVTVSAGPVSVRSLRDLFQQSLRGLFR